MEEFDLTKITGFQWDKHNTEKIREKHDVEPFEVEQVLLGYPLFISDGVKADQSKEFRYVVLGETEMFRKLAVVFTLRNKELRPISARPMSRKERKQYE